MYVRLTWSEVHVVYRLPELHVLPDGLHREAAYLSLVSILGVCVCGWMAMEDADT